MQIRSKSIAVRHNILESLAYLKGHIYDLRRDFLDAQVLVS